jgi:hypothetical protein
MSLLNFFAQLWDLLEGKKLFKQAFSSESDEYDDQLHLGYITALLGPAPIGLLKRGRRTSQFYQTDGISTFCIYVRLLTHLLY